MLFDAKAVCHGVVKILDLHAEEAALHSTVIQQVFDDVKRHVDGNGKADAGIHAGA